MTLNEIEQRLSALKEEQDKLTAELERLKAEQAEVKPWRAEENADFFFLNGSGYVRFEDDCRTDFDNKRFHIGNYYRTRELAEQDAKELALRGKVRQLRDALCEGYQFKNGEDNYCIWFDCTAKKYYPFLNNGGLVSINEIYFDTQEHAQTVCDILNAEMRSDG